MKIIRQFWIFYIRVWSSLRVLTAFPRGSWANSFMTFYIPTALRRKEVRSIRTSAGNAPNGPVELLRSILLYAQYYSVGSFGYILESCVKI